MPNGDDHSLHLLAFKRSAHLGRNPMALAVIVMVIARRCQHTSLPTYGGEVTVHEEQGNLVGSLDFPGLNGHRWGGR